MTTPREGVPFRVGRGPAVYWDHDKDRFVAAGDDDYVDPGVQPVVDPSTAQRYPNAHYRVCSGVWTLELGPPAAVPEPAPAAAAPAPAPPAPSPPVTTTATAAPAPAPAAPGPPPAPAARTTPPPSAPPLQPAPSPSDPVGTPAAAPTPAAAAPPPPPPAPPVEVPGPPLAPTPPPAEPVVEARPEPPAPAPPAPATPEPAPPAATVPAPETPAPPAPKAAEPPPPEAAPELPPPPRTFGDFGETRDIKLSPEPTRRERRAEKRQARRTNREAAATPFPPPPVIDETTSPLAPPSDRGERTDGWLDDYHQVAPYEALRDLEAPPAPADEPPAPTTRPEAPSDAPTTPEATTDAPAPPETDERPAAAVAAPAPAPAPAPPAATSAPAPPPPPAPPAPPGDTETETDEARAERERAELSESIWRTRPTVPAPERSTPRGRRIAAIVVVLAVVAAAIGVGAMLISGDDDGGTKQPKVSFPAKWDPKVDALVQFVERERQAAFSQPVHVDYLDDARFAARARDIVRAQHDSVHTLLQQPAGTLRALGILQSDANAMSILEKYEANRRAIYSPTTQRIAVRGTTLDQDTKVALVRALTLALDQQRFGLRDVEDGEAAWAYNALREGDAVHVADAYVNALDPAERSGLADPFDPGIAGPNDAIRVLAQAPGVLGAQFVAGLLADGGTAALARAFQDPPFSQEHLYDPTAFVNGNDPKDVDPPKLQDGEKQQGDGGTFGPVTLLAVLGEHTAPDVALRAADGWGGDAWVRYQYKDRDCIRDDWIGDARGDVDEMAEAAGAWVTAMPPGDTSFTNQNGVITLSGCDPVSGSAQTTGTAVSAFAYVNLRAKAFEQQVAAKVPVDKAWCVAKKVAAGATLEDAQNPDVLTNADYAARLAQYGTECA